MHGGARSAVGVARESGYAALVLDRLARHTCGVVGADAAGVLIRDRRDPHYAFNAAGCGLGAERVGDRVELRPGVIRDVMSRARSRRIEDSGEVAELIGGDAPPGTGACAPLQFAGDGRGAVWAVARAERPFERRRRRLLEDMAKLTETAIDHAARHERLEMGAQAAVEALAAAIDLRDGYTGEHSAEVVDVALNVGRLLELDRVALVELACAARLHDVGKIGVPDAVLRKPTSLTREEWALMRRHPRDGADLLARIPGLEAVAAIVRFHHERVDGQGYPDGLEGEQIPVASRIVAVCDAYGAMTADRPYRPRLPLGAARDELEAHAGSQFDPQVVEALLTATG